MKGTRWIHTSLEAAPPMEALRGRAAVIDYLDGGAAQVTLYQDGAQVVTTLAERHCPTNDAAREQARRWVEEGVRT